MLGGSSQCPWLLSSNTILEQTRRTPWSHQASWSLWSCKWYLCAHTTLLFIHSFGGAVMPLFLL